MIMMRHRTDGADADTMTMTERKIVRAMSSGYTLNRFDVQADYGFGAVVKWHNGEWKRGGKIKAHLMLNRSALFSAFQEWADGLRGKGWDVELS